MSARAVKKAGNNYKGDPAYEIELAEALGEFTHDPLGAVFFLFPWGQAGTALAEFSGPEPWQCESLERLGDALSADPFMPVQEAIYSGHGVGKSANVAHVINWGLSTHVKTRVNATAGTLAQLRTKLIPEVGKWTRMAINAHWWDIQKASIQHVEHRDEWRADFLAWDEHNPEAFAGLHNQGRRTILIVDEASQVAQVILETMKGAMTDARTEIMLLARGNPTRNTGWFASAAKGQEAKHWMTARVDSREVSISNHRLIAQWAEAHGEDSDFFRVRVRGEFPNASVDQFIPLSLAADARKRVVGFNLHEPLIMGIDVGRQGDRSVFAYRRGLDARAVPWKVLRIDDVIEVAQRAALEIEEKKPDVIFVDVGSFGYGVYDYLRKLGYPVIAVDFGTSPVRQPSAELPMMFLNRRAEIWGVMREWLRGGAIPDDPELEQDLIGPEYYHQEKTQKIFLESKDDMKARDLESPDMADALAVTFGLPVAMLTVELGAMRQKQREAHARGEAGSNPYRDYDPINGAGGR